jgi:hypothetical protein
MRNNLADAPTRFVVVMFGVAGQPVLIPVSAAELEERRPRRARFPCPGNQANDAPIGHATCVTVKQERPETFKL